MSGSGSSFPQLQSDSWVGHRLLDSADRMREILVYLSASDLAQLFRLVSDYCCVVVVIND